MTADISTIHSWADLWAFLKGLAASAGIQLLYGLILLVLGGRLIKWLLRRIVKERHFTKMDKSLQTFVLSLLRVLLYTLLIVSFASILGVPQTSFVALLTSAGVAIGLALQGALANLAGGVIILLFKPFRVGDYIRTQEVEGTVHDISVFYTTIISYDNKKITLPNGTITNAVIVDYTSQPTRRVDLKFGVGYGSDIDRVKAVLLETADRFPLVLKDPPPFVGLSEHGDSALIFALNSWCNTEDYWKVYFGMNEAVKKALDQNGIEIPFPQRDVHWDGSGGV